jgi:hypothetical protein
MAPSSSLLARLSEVLGRRRSRATPPADFRFDVPGACQRVGITRERRSCANFVSAEPEDDGLPRADAGIDKPRHAEPFVDPYMAAIDRH